MKRLLYCLWMCCCISVHAQQITVNGKLVSPENTLYQTVGNYTNISHGYPGYGLQQLSAIAIANTSGNHLHVFVRGECQDTAFNFVLYINVPSKTGIPIGTALPAGDNVNSPFYAANIKLDMQADYGFRINNHKTAGSDSFDVSMIDYTNANHYDQYLGTGVVNFPTYLSGHHIPAGSQPLIHLFDSTKVGFYQSGNLSTNLNYGAEIEFNTDSLGIANGDVIQLFVYYTNANGNYAAMDCIPQVTSLSTNPGANGSGGTAATATFSYQTLAGTQAANYTCNFLSTPPVGTNLTATPDGSHHSHITWTDVATNETGYHIERSSFGAAGPYIVLDTLPVNSTDFTDLNQQPLDTFWYRINAFNNLGPSPYSTIAFCTVPDTVPYVPTALFATGISSSKIKLVWNDNATNEIKYMIEQSGNGVSGWVLIDSVPANTTTDTILNLLPVTVYYYRVYGKNAVGNSVYSNIATDTTLNGVPFAPGLLTTTATSTTTIHLTWLDNSSNETQFILEYMPQGGSWLPIPLQFNTTSYTHTSLTPNTIYYYRILATNALGNSPYSATVFDTTFAVNSGNGISDWQHENPGFIISPNPSSGELKIEGTKHKIQKVEVVNLLGKIEITEKTDAYLMLLNVKVLPNGIYFIKTTDERGNVQTSRVVKQ